MEPPCRFKCHQARAPVGVDVRALTRAVSQGRSVADKPFYKSEVFWAGVAAICSAIASAVALATIFVTLTSWKNEQQLKKPYFSISNQSIKEKDNAHVLSFSLKNIGVYPAEQVRLKICWVGPTVGEKPKCQEHQMAMSVPGLSKPEPEIFHFYVEEPIRVVALGIAYDHSVLNKSYRQSHFVKVVAKHGERLPFLLNVSKEEQDLFVGIFKNDLREFL